MSAIYHSVSHTAKTVLVYFCFKIDFQGLIPTGLTQRLPLNINTKLILLIKLLIAHC